MSRPSGLGGPTPTPSPTRSTPRPQQLPAEPTLAQTSCLRPPPATPRSPCLPRLRHALLPRGQSTLLLALARRPDCSPSPRIGCTCACALEPPTASWRSYSPTWSRGRRCTPCPPPRVTGLHLALHIRVRHHPCPPGSWLPWKRKERRQIHRQARGENKRKLSTLRHYPSFASKILSLRRLVSADLFSLPVGHHGHRTTHRLQVVMLGCSSVAPVGDPHASK